MRELRSHPDLDQLRRQARELVRGARAGDVSALQRLADVEAPFSLAGAQLALAREQGFASWPKLKAEVERRRSHEPSFVIRRVRSLDELKKLWAIVNVILGSPTPFARPHWHVFDDFAAKRSLFLMVEHEGRLIGGTIESRLIALEPWARGLGLGMRLVQTVEAELLLQGRTLGWHADPDNKGFFLRLGYTERGRTKRHMSKGAPVSPRLLERRLRMWRDRAGDLDGGVTVTVDPASGKVAPLPW